MVLKNVLLITHSSARHLVILATTLAAACLKILHISKHGLDTIGIEHPNLRSLSFFAMKPTRPTRMMMTDYLKLPNRKKKNIHFVEKLVIDDDYILSHSHVTNYSGTT